MMRRIGHLARLLMLLSVAVLVGCATAPQRTVTVTTKDGKVYETIAPEIVDPRTHADGTRADWVEIAWMKSMGALPAPPKPMPVWSCYAADLGTTALGIGVFGLVEANPIPWAINLPLGVGEALYAKHAEKAGRPYFAKVFSIVHCFAAVWNVIAIVVWAF